MTHLLESNSFNTNCADFQRMSGIIIIIIIITPLSRLVLEKLIVAQLFKKFSAFYRALRFIIVFTRALHRSLP
jgi:hypothetical protein